MTFSNHGTDIYRCFDLLELSVDKEFFAKFLQSHDIKFDEIGFCCFDIIHPWTIFVIMNTGTPMLACDEHFNNDKEAFYKPQNIFRLG